LNRNCHALPLMISALISLLAVPSVAQFETRGSSVVNYYPLSLTVADFNHDGKLDVAAAALYTGQVAVLLGRGDGTFQPAVYYNIDPKVESVAWVAVADFNRDGNMDLAVADRLGRNISILLGNGDGTFRPPMAFPVNAQPNDVVVGDFNHDGNPDVAVCDSPYVSVLLGNGDGTLRTPIDVTPSIPPLAIGVGDFNRDGKLDVASVGGATGAVTIFFGNGDGTLTTGESFPVGTDPESVVTGDFNHDGKLDLAVADFIGSAISVLLGNGDGTFRNAVYYPAPFPGPIWVADVDGDGNADLVFPSADLSIRRYGRRLASVLLGNSDGTFRPMQTYSAGKEPFFVAAGDFNGDHKLDLVVADYLGSALGVLLNTGVISFRPTTPLRFPRQLVGTTSPSQSVTLTNTGTAALSISSICVKGPYLLQQNCGSSVAAGASCTLSAKFQPVTPGNVGGLISISDSASSKPQVIELRGGGTVVAVSPTQLTFPAQTVGTKSAPQKLTVTNTGSTAVDITSVKLAGRNPDDFPTQNNCSAQIAPGGSCTLSVSFTPTAKGARRAAAEINDDGGANPQGAQLNGTGD